MKNQIKIYGNIIALFLMFSSLITYAQVGIGTSNPDVNSSLDLRGGTTNNKGFVLPMALSTQPFNTSNPKGTLLYNETDSLIYYLIDPDATPQRINALSPWFYNPAGTDIITTVKDVKLNADNIKLGLGLENDLQLFHDGVDNHIRGLTGDLKIEVKTSENGVVIKKDGATELYHDNNLKLATSATGVTVTGDINSSSGKIKELGNDLIPAGVIVMWSGTTPPAGWALCDGTGSGLNKRPNLKGRFIVGYDPTNADYNKVTRDIATASIGGSVNHSHSIPDHKHSMNHDHVAFNVSIPQSTWTDGDKSGCAGIWEDGNELEFLKYNADGDISADPPEYTGNTGDKTAFATNNSDNLPPFYTLAYIIKL